MKTTRLLSCRDVNRAITHEAEAKTHKTEGKTHEAEGKTKKLDYECLFLFTLVLYPTDQYIPCNMNK
jgi:hypothetical protein